MRKRTAVQQADVVLFRFCAETIQPVALYELRFHAARGAETARGAEPAVGAYCGYEHRRDIIAQFAHQSAQLADLGPERAWQEG